VNGQGAATSIGILPPAGGTCRMWRYGADHAPARERSIDRSGSLLRQQVPKPRGERRRTRRKAVPPLKTRRTTSPSVEPQQWRREATRSGETQALPGTAASKRSERKPLKVDPSPG